MRSKPFSSLLIGSAFLASFFAFGEESGVLPTEMTLNEYLSSKNLTVKMGHCYSGTTQQPEFFKTLLEEHPEIDLIAEIGFNAGHSSDLFLKSNSHAKLYSFDLGKFRYTKPAKEYIDQNYPDRHVLILGNSLDTVPEFKNEHEELKFDLIFIDGGHSYNCALNDIANMKAFAHENTLLVIDDTKIKGVKEAYVKSIENGVITKGEIIRSKHKAWALCKYKF